MPTVYPCVPGHEIVGPRDQGGIGGEEVQGRAIWRRSAAWWIRIGRVPECKAGLEQFCPNLTLTYNFPDKHTGRRDVWRLLGQHRGG